jgi:hypothetical protein
MGSDAEPGTRPPLGYDQGSVATTWMISLRAVEAINMRAANLLRLWAFVDHKDMFHGLIQEATLNNEKFNEWPDWLCEMASSEAKFFEAARLLCRYSMIEANECLSGSYNMHPVVHRWALYMQYGAENSRFPLLALQMVVWSTPRLSKGDLGNIRFDWTVEGWKLQTRILQHKERYMQWVDQTQTPICELEEIMNKLKHVETIRSFCNTFHGLSYALGLRGDNYASRLRLEDNTAIYQLALESYLKILVSDLEQADPRSLVAVNDLDRSTETRLFEEALVMSRRASGGLEATFDPDQDLGLDMVRTLASLCAQLGRHGEAVVLLHQATAAYAKIRRE